MSHPAGDRVDAPVLYERRGPVAWVTIDRPASRNALSSDVRAGLWDATRRFNADDDAQVLVLTGTGDRAFCAGGDLKEMAATGLEVPGPDFLPHFGRSIDVPKPTIAAVNGVAFAGGFLLALMCDLCVAAEHASFAITEARVGRGAPWAALLPDLVGRRAALQLLLTAEPVDARRAQLMGLVNEVVPSSELGPAAQRLAETIAANAPLSVLAGKRMVSEVSRLPPHEAYARADDIWEPAYRSEDAQEGPLAFRERRPPQWKRR
jgi:enoyl-CoA hydratase/carnithine racemase